MINIAIAFLGCVVVCGSYPHDYKQALHTNNGKTFEQTETYKSGRHKRTPNDSGLVSMHGIEEKNEQLYTELSRDPGFQANLNVVFGPEVITMKSETSGQSMDEPGKLITLNHNIERRFDIDTRFESMGTLRNKHRYWTLPDEYDDTVPNIKEISTASPTVPTTSDSRSQPNDVENKDIDDRFQSRSTLQIKHRNFILRNTNPDNTTDMNETSTAGNTRFTTGISTSHGTTNSDHTSDITDTSNAGTNIVPTAAYDRSYPNVTENQGTTFIPQITQKDNSRGQQENGANSIRTRFCVYIIIHSLLLILLYS